MRPLQSAISSATQAADLDRTAENRKLVLDWSDRVLIGADYAGLTEFVSTDIYLQHNPEAADGLEGFGAAAAMWGAQGKSLAYRAVHQVIAEGSFVVTRCEGEFGVPVSYNDLWRIEEGKIVEHWVVITPIPAELPHSNGVF